MEDYLSHHGILGQKWGHQNGPPYPLRPGMHSALEKAKGAVSSASKAVKSYRIKRKRKQSLEKARAAKAENKRKETAALKKEEKKKKKDERFNKFIETSNKIDKAREAIEKDIKAYNLAVSIAGPFIEKKFGVELKKVNLGGDKNAKKGPEGASGKKSGGDSKERAMQYIEKVYNNYTIYDNSVDNSKFRSRTVSRSFDRSQDYNYNYDINSDNSGPLSTTYIGGTGGEKKKKK